MLLNKNDKKRIIWIMFTYYNSLHLLFISLLICHYPHEAEIVGLDTIDYDLHSGTKRKGSIWEMLK